MGTNGKTTKQRNVKGNFFLFHLIKKGVGQNVPLNTTIKKGANHLRRPFKCFLISLTKQIHDKLTIFFYQLAYRSN